MCGNSGKHVFEPGEGLHTYPLTGCREASQDGCSLAAPVTAEEDPVVASHRYTTDIALGGIVIDAQISVFAVARQRRPVLQAIAHRASRRTLRQYFLLDLFQIAM